MTIFTRRVESGSFPLYRLVVLGILISAILQALLFSVPASVAAVVPGVLVYFYWLTQAGGAALLLLGLYTEKARKSLHLERVGAITLATSGFMYFAAVCINLGMIPLSTGTWVIFAFSLYLVYRVWKEIPRELHAVEVAARKIFGEG